MRCALVLTSFEASNGLFRMTGFESAGFDHFAISLFAGRPAENLVNSSRRGWSAMVGIAKRFPSLAFRARRQLQASASVEITDNGGR
jgi:hypothetical protein